MGGSPNSPYIQLTVSSHWFPPKCFNCIFILFQLVKLVKISFNINYSHTLNVNFKAGVDFFIQQ